MIEAELRADLARVAHVMGSLGQDFQRVDQPRQRTEHKHQSAQNHSRANGSAASRRYGQTQDEERPFVHKTLGKRCL